MQIAAQGVKKAHFCRGLGAKAPPRSHLGATSDQTVPQILGNSAPKTY